jgi:hypothetical protein
VQKNGEVCRLKVRQMHLFSDIQCTNHAIGTPGGKNERNDREKRHPLDGPAQRPSMFA